MKKSIIISLSTLLLAMLLACGAGSMTPAEAQEACRKDPTCHPAPEAVQIQMAQTEQAGR